MQDRRGEKRVRKENEGVTGFLVHIKDHKHLYCVVNLHCWNVNVKALGAYALNPSYIQTPASHLSDRERTIGRSGFRGPVSVSALYRDKMMSHAKNKAG